jgi:hypothetical protein
VGGRGHVAVCRRPARPPWRLQTHCCLWGDDPALPAMGFETVFLSVRPIVESLALGKPPELVDPASRLGARVLPDHGALCHLIVMRGHLD